MKNKKCVVGIDFGTTSLSAVLLNIEDCIIEKVYSYNTDAYIAIEDDRVKEQSVEKLALLFDNLIQEIVNLPKIEIEAFAFTGQMHGIIGLNKDGIAVTNLVTWQDKSGDIINAQGLTILEEIRQLTGVKTISNGYGIVTLYKWLNYDKRTDINSFCTVPDYFGRKLAQVYGPVKISSSMAHSIGLFDIHQNEWQFDLIKKLKLDNVNFPIINSDNQIIGETKNTPVLTAIGDNQSSFIGSVIHKNNTVLLNVGTGTQLSFLIHRSEYLQYKRYIDDYETQLRPYDEQHYLVATSFLNGGSVYKSLFNFFKDIALNLFGYDNVDDKQLWSRMMYMGSECINSSTPINVSPLLEGQRKDPKKGATISNLHTSNFTSGDFVAGFLKGLANYYKSGLFPELENRTRNICGSGNGLKRNKLFCEIIENTFGYPLILTTFDEEAAVGAAINACCELGILNDDSSSVFLEKLSKK